LYQHKQLLIIDKYTKQGSLFTGKNERRFTGKPLRYIKNIAIEQERHIYGEVYTKKKQITHEK